MAQSGNSKNDNDEGKKIEEFLKFIDDNPSFLVNNACLTKPQIDLVRSFEHIEKQLNATKEKIHSHMNNTLNNTVANANMKNKYLNIDDDTLEIMSKLTKLQSKLS